MISTAPYSSAFSVVCAPSSARLEQITTGIGCWLMIFCRNVRPSMRGISISSVITSGTWSRIRSAATNGSLAVPITSMAGSSDRTSLRVWRTTAESSTIRTRILGWFIAHSLIPRVRTGRSSARLAPGRPNGAGALRRSRCGNGFVRPRIPPRSDAGYGRALPPPGPPGLQAVHRPHSGPVAAVPVTGSTSAPPNTLTSSSRRQAPSASNWRARWRMLKST